jgi:transposase-like protein
VSKAIFVATGVTAKGDREVFGFAIGDSKEDAFWTAFLRSVRARGLGGVCLTMSDAHEARGSLRRTAPASRAMAASPGRSQRHQTGASPPP